ncbi:peptidase [Kineococcus radiotolerans]|uniref:Peptidase domain protein n=1 Tax=Kineococcus radiotolerans (strain ATCC BAA-149 / DSM 14245 / SRS30216) TaxID=266940 RepID=A6W9D8_KINRD|nr:peptidase [Kineococcus radiotolerans]ABS03427.1 peptidase domain protein [Kineococcus radiotolerans SRS30216 = ATCC BAA-149]
MNTQLSQISRHRKVVTAGVLTAAALLAGAGVASAAGPVTGTGTGSGAHGVPAATVIHFAHGATAASVKGTVGPGEDDRYVFDAKAGQTASFHLARSTSAQTWTLVGPSGPAVHDAHSSRQSDFTYRLPETGRYYVDIVSTRPSSYRLDLSIPASTKPVKPTKPAKPSTGTEPGNGGGVHGDLPVVAEATKIDFPAGRTSASVTAKVGPQDRAAYTFEAKAGQRARIQLDGSSTGTFALIAPDGTPLHTTKSRNQSDVTVTLPTSGLYRIDVQDAVHTGAQQLTLSIPRR